MPGVRIWVDYDCDGYLDYFCGGVLARVPEFVGFGVHADDAGVVLNTRIMGGGSIC